MHDQLVEVQEELLVAGEDRWPLPVLCRKLMGQFEIVAITESFLDSSIPVFTVFSP